MTLFTRACALAWALLAALSAQAQVVATLPSFPTIDDAVTILYNPRLGNGALANTSTIYGHFGLVVAGPTSTAWTRVVGTWGTPDARVLMTRQTDGNYTITFTPRSFFANTAGVQGYRLAMVFRSADGNTVGRSETGGDLFVPLYQPGEQAARFTRPLSGTNTLLQANTATTLLLESSTPANLRIIDNGNVIASTTGAALLSYNYQTARQGVHKIYGEATFGNGTIRRDSITYIVAGAPRIAPLPPGIKDGPNYPTPTSAVLVLMAPKKKNVFVRGDFNNWAFDTAYAMNMTPDSGRFWLEINNLQPGRSYIYQFTIDGTLTVADPLSEVTSDPSDNGISSAIYPNLPRYPADKATGIASVLRPGRTPYVFRHPRPIVPRQKLTVYEVLLRDFLGRSIDKSFQGLIDTVAYLQKLGINAVHLMPVSEFEGNNSWGYNVSFHGAVDKTYGPDDKLKALIDTLHGRGIQVLLDVVYNHAFSQSPLVQMYPVANSPWCNAVARHDFNVGTDLNHENPFLQAYMDRCNERWLTEFNVDGFRFDLSKGFTQRNTLGNTGLWGQLDRSRVRLLARMAAQCRTYYPQSTLILEHLGENREEIILSDSLNFLLWGNMNGAARQAIKGMSNGADLFWGYYTARGWRQPNLLTYYESHDEERLVFDARNNARTTTTYNGRSIPGILARSKALAALLLSQPGPKMLWQFQEMGYDFSINRCPAGNIDPGCRTDPKPPRWDYYRDSTARRTLAEVYRAMLRLRATEPVFSSASNVLILNGALGGRRVLLRGGADGDALTVCNLDLGTVTTTAGFSRTGRWYEFFSGDSLEVTNVTQTLQLLPGEVRIYSTKRLTPPEPGLITALRQEWRQLASQPLSVSPNPATRLVEITGTEGQPVTCTLLGTDGRTLGSLALPTGQTMLDLGTLPCGKPAPGLYLLRIADAGGAVRTLRLQVQ